LLLIKEGLFSSEMIKDSKKKFGWKRMDISLWDVPNFSTLVYHLGINLIKHFIKNGKIVVKEGRVLREN